jgi:hypothetical protein
VVAAAFESTFGKIRYAQDCLKLQWDDQQGFMASGVQLYHTNGITIRENIMVSLHPVREALFCLNSGFLFRMPLFPTPFALLKIMPSVW